jgi:hypothetical protein
MKNVCRLVSLCTAFFSLSTSAEPHTFFLHWKKEWKQIETPQGNFFRPDFEYALHDESLNFMPVFKTSFYSSFKVNYTLSNAKFTKVDSATASLLPVLNSEPMVEVNHGKSALRNITVIKIFPYRRNPESREIEKLLSFELVETRAPEHNEGKAARGNRDYVQNSVLASGNWIRIGVNKTSMHKITYKFIKSNFGIEPANIHFSNFGVFGNYCGQLNEVAGQAPISDDLLELPLFVTDKNGNGKFDSDDFVLFYGESPHTWTYPGNHQPFVHQKHHYTDKNFYFVTIDKGTGKKVAVENFSGNYNTTINQFQDYAFHEQDEKNFLESGRMWFGNRMSSARTSVDINFSFPNLITSSPVRVVSAVVARTPQTTSSGATQIKCAEGSNVICQHSINGSGSPQYGTVAIYQVRNGTLSATSDNLKLTYTYNSIDNTGEAFIDYVEVNCQRTLVFTGSSMNFRNTDVIGPSSVSQFQIGNASHALQVWDVTNPFEAKGLPVNNGSFVTPTSYLKEFVAFNPDGNFPEPEFVEKVANQNLHACGQPDMVILTHPSFLSAANRLADFHRSFNQLTVFVTTPQLIYNEFSSGKQDPAAIRNFMKMLYDRAGGDTNLIPRYLLLLGDGSFDMLNRNGSSTNFIPTYQSYESLNEIGTFVSDDFFGLLDDGEGGNILGANNFIDVAIGRLPVGTLAEANGVVDKIIHYKSSNTLGNWRNRLTFVADDEDGNVHFSDCNSFADYLAEHYPVYNQNKIYLDAYQRVNTPAGARYPDVNAAILNALNRGTLILNYVGHGGVNNWAHERIFNFNDIQQLSNYNTLPLFVTATCEFSKFDRSGGQTAGENLIVNPKGGGIASITTVRVVYSYQNKQLNDALIRNLFKPYHGKTPTMGELLLQAKNSIWNGNDPNNRKFLLLGDPALSLNYPRLQVVTTAINDSAVGNYTDTMKALQQITIQGEVRHPDGTLAGNFNGFVYPTIFDKVSILTTLANSPGSSKAPFKIYRNIVFNGKASVQNGQFSFSFVVPKDIDYRVGKARISYYAQDPSQNIDAHGLDTTIFIGGSIGQAETDENGPIIHLFMNNENFRSGGITDANPKLLALLEDDFGINVSNSLGHEITAVLDENTSQPIVLNEYFENELNTFKRGRVLYPFYKLENGEHTLTVKAWDTHNNSAEASIRFIVSTSPALALEKIFCYPNPFSSATTFSFEHNAADKPLQVDVHIYSLNGNLVRHIQAEFTPSGYRENNLQWKGDTDAGGAAMQGIYLYRITITDKQGNQSAKSDRVVIIR